jgi:chromosomal replication initiator protein
MEVEQKLWETIKGELEISVSQTNFNMLINQSEITELDGEKIVISSYNVFVHKNIELKCKNDIIKALKHNGYQNPVIEFVINHKKKSSQIKQQPKNQSLVANYSSNDPKIIDGLNPRYTFDNFIIGSSNDLAYAAAERVAEQPGKIYNPLFIYGGVGLGKTHLIQAIGNKIRLSHPKLKIIYVTAEQFTNSYVNYIRTKDQNYHKKFRETDILIIDDIQFIAGKEKVEEDFFNTFNSLYLKNKQIIIAGDRHPSTISGLTDRMQSRLGMGMTIDITLPPYEMRMAIIQKKAEEKSINIEPDAVEFLAEQIKTNIRDLEGILTPILARCEIQGITADLDLVKGCLGGMKITRTKHITPRQIITKTSGYFGIKPEELCSSSRVKHIITPRHIASYLMRTELNESYPNIAKAVGRKDWTTIISSFRKIDRDIKLDINLRNQINDIREKLYV